MAEIGKIQFYRKRSEMMDKIGYRYYITGERVFNPRGCDDPANEQWEYFETCDLAQAIGMSPREWITAWTYQNDEEGVKECDAIAITVFTWMLGEARRYEMVDAEIWRKGVHDERVYRIEEL